MAQGAVLSLHKLRLIDVQVATFFMLAPFCGLLFALLLVVRSAWALNRLADGQSVLVGQRFLVPEGQFGILVSLLSLDVISGDIHLVMLDIFPAVHQTYYQNIQNPRCFFKLSQQYITHPSINNSIMSIKWYEQYLEQIIRENQGLKYEVRKHQHTQNVAVQLAAVFQELFPDVPPMISTRENCTHELLEYYRKAAGKWLQKQKAQLQFLLLSNETSLSATPNPKNNLEASNKKGYNQEYVSKLGLQFRHEQDLINKMDQMEATIVQLKKEIANFQREQQKYISQIASLRSITKKLEFQLAQRLLVNERLKRSMAKEQERLEKEVAYLTKQTLTWREEYERIWNQNQKQKSNLFHIQKCEEQTLFNTSCKDDREHAEEENNQSNTWIIRAEDSEQSYIVDDRLDVSSRSGFRAEKR